MVEIKKDSNLVLTMGDSLRNLMIYDQKIFLVSVVIGSWLVGCATYQPQTLPSASDIISSQKLHSFEERNISKVKSLSTIATEVIQYNPNLRSMRYDLNISDALVLNAGLLPDPSVGFSFAAPLGETGLSNALGASIGWSLGALFARANEVDRAKIERKMTIASYAWQVRLHVANALVLAGRLNYLEEQQKIAAKNLDLAEQLLETTRQKTAIFDETVTVESSRKMMMMDALDSQAKINDQIASTRHELNYQLGLSPLEVFEVAPFELNEIDPDSNVLFEQAEKKRDDLIAKRLAYQVSDAVYRRNLLAQFPSFTFTLNWSSDTSKIETFGPSVAFDLPLWNRNQGGIALSKALRNKEKDSFAVALERTQNDIVSLIDTLKRNEALLMKAKRESIDNQKLLHTLTQAFKSGNLTLNDYVTKVYELNAKNLWMSRLKQAIFEQRIALSLASGSNILGEFK